MSDRVWFATNKRTPATESSFFEGFPFSPSAGPYSPTSYEQLGSWTHLKAVEEWWRIKKVRLQVSAVIERGTAPTREWTTYTGDTTSNLRTVLFTRERDLCKSAYTAGLWFCIPGNYIDESTSFEDGSPDYDLSGAWYSDFQTTRMYATNREPSNGLTAGVQVSAIGPIIDTDSTTTFVGTGTILGQTFNFYNGIAGDTVLSFSFTVTPYEYWPYAASDGTAIYNTSTGAQLQDPRN